MPGRRLVYSVSILWLATTHPVMAAILVLLALLFLSYRQTLRHGGPDLVVVMVPWAREEPHPEGHLDRGAGSRGAGNGRGRASLRLRVAIRASRPMAVALLGGALAAGPPGCC